MSEKSMQVDSGQSSKSVYSPSGMERQPLPPPKKHLPLRKRLTAESTSKAVTKQLGSLEEEEESSLPKGGETAEYPPTPGSHSSSSSSDSTLPLVHSPPMEESSSKKQPLKKTCTWMSTRGKTTVLVKTLNNVGLPGNPLLWNNGNKYEPEDTIDLFKTAWLKGQEEEDDEDEEEDDDNISITEEEVDKKINKKAIPLSSSSSSSSKRGRPPLSKPLDTLKSHQKQTSQDGKLYCICRQPYDATRFMIACDRCDDWFHGECIGINEKESEFIDLYFCNKCSKITKKTTSWKPKCANPACYKAARIGINLGYLSKYCSDSCGMQVARARLELAEIKRRNNNNTSSSSSNEPIAQLALKKQRRLRVHSFADKEDRRRLQKIKQEKIVIRDLLQVINQRHELFQLINNTTASGTCHFNSRLVYSDRPPETCTKVDCSQHQQWRKIISLQIEQDKKEQYDLLLALEKERKRIKERLRKRRNGNNVLEDEFLINTTVEAT